MKRSWNKKTESSKERKQETLSELYRKISWDLLKLST